MAMNMGHCRFENTLEALKECASSLEEADSIDDLLGKLSTTERQSAIKLFELCSELAADWNDFELYSEQQEINKAMG